MEAKSVVWGAGFEAHQEGRNASVWPGWAVILFGLGVLRLCIVVATTPLLAYGNNYDFTRQSACIGLWQQYGDRPRDAVHAEGPVNRLVYDHDVQPDACMRSIDDIFPYWATRFHAVGDQVDFREVGAWKGLFVCLLAGLFIFSVAPPLLRLVFAALFFLVFGDIAVLAYFNTLFTEVSVIVGCYVAVCFAVLLTAVPELPSRTSRATGIVALIWLGLAKQQYLGLAALLTIYCALLLAVRGADRRTCAALALVACAFPLAFSLANRADRPIIRGIRLANATNAFLASVLPSAHDVSKAVRTVGLPEHCVKAVGLSWYSPGIQLAHPCPEVASLSRLNFLPLFVSQPITFYRPMHRVAIWSWPGYPTSVGRTETDAVTRTRAFRFIKRASLSSAYERMPARGFAILALSCAISGLLCLGALGLRRVRQHERWRLWCALCAAGGVVVLYALASAMYGDGYSDVPKHTSAQLVGIACVLLAWLGGAVQCCRLGARRLAQMSWLRAHSVVSHP